MSSVPSLLYGLANDWQVSPGDREYYWDRYMPDGAAHWLAVALGLPLLALLGSTIVDAHRSPLRSFALPVLSARIVMVGGLAGIASTALAIYRIHQASAASWSSGVSMTRAPIVMLLGFLAVAGASLVLCKARNS